MLQFCPAGTIGACSYLSLKWSSHLRSGGLRSDVRSELRHAWFNTCTRRGFSCQLLHLVHTGRPETQDVTCCTEAQYVTIFTETQDVTCCTETQYVTIFTETQDVTCFTETQYVTILKHSTLPSLLKYKTLPSLLKHSTLPPSLKHSTLPSSLKHSMLPSLLKHSYVTFFTET